MVVFVEYVLVDNFIIDYLLMISAFKICKKPYKKRRIFLCAVFGSLFALIYPLIATLTITVLLKIAFGFLLMLIATKYNSLKEYLINTGVFFLLTFLLGGCIIGVFYLFNIDYSTEFFVAIVFIPAYLIISGVNKAIKYLYRRKTISSNIIKCKMFYGEKCLEINGFIDTGNRLYYKENPVIVCGKGIAIKLLDKDIIKLKYMEYSTADGNAKMPIFTADKIEIYFGDEPSIYNNITVGVAKGGYGVGYDIILHPDLIGGRDVKRNT